MGDGPRPDTLVVVAGTGTEVGKTWVACRLISKLRDRGLQVAARKPVQSFEPGDDLAGTTDADLLAAVSGEDTLTVCPPHRRLRVPMAPPMAADALDLPTIALADLVEEVTGSWPDRPADIGIVELAGGLRSPIAHDGDGVDLIAALAPDRIVIVADAGLGTINAVLTSLDALAPASSQPATPGGAGLDVGVHLNRFDEGDDLHRRNRDWLTACLAEREPQPIRVLSNCLATCEFIS